MATKTDYLTAAARAADKVYAKIVELHCVHKSGANTWAKLLSKKRTTCAASGSITYQLAGILPTGKTVNHRKAVGGSDANILRKKPTIYIQDSNVCVCAGGGAIYSCNNSKGYQVNAKGQYVKDKITSGYAFKSPILVVIVPRVVGAQGATTTTTKKEEHNMDTLRNGDKGQQIKVLQKLLGGLDIDGEFGPLTEAAVRAYQKKKGLDVDGIVGPKTWGAMLA